MVQYLRLANSATNANLGRTIRILRADYVQKSQEMGKWLEESQFVIQNHEFATSAMHWKQIHITTGKKPFSGWKCALSIEKSRRPGFVRLLRAGDAEIVDSVDEVELSLILLLH